jgi:Leucine-rich repeat (LRR) protein
MATYNPKNKKWEIGPIQEWESLCLPYQRFFSMDISTFAVKKLQLTGNMAEVPADLIKLSKLEGLDLSRNKIDILPDFIGEVMVNLTELNLNHNALQSIPDNIENLTNMVKLNLSHNMLTGIPNCIKYLPNLKSIDLSYNPINDVFDYMFDIFDESTTFYLDGCNFTQEQVVQIMELINQEEYKGPKIYISIFDRREEPNEIQNQEMESSWHNLIEHLRNTIDHNEIAEIERERAEAEAFANSMVLSSARRSSSGGWTRVQQQQRDLYTIEDYTRNSRLLESSNANYERHMEENRLLIERNQETQRLLRLRRASTKNKTVPQILFDTVENLVNIDHNKIKTWLLRIEDIFEFKNDKELFKVICLQITEFLKEADLTENTSLREALYIIIENATETCGDRMALSIVYIDIQRSLNMYKFDLNKLFKILINGSWTLHTLENFARYKVSTLKSVDELEVYLGYIIMLKQDLDIPINIKNMLYYSCSCITEQDLDDAKKFILKNRYTTETYKFLSEQEVWVNGLNHNFPEKIKNIVDKRNLNENYEKAFETYKSELVELTIDCCKDFLVGL